MEELIQEERKEAFEEGRREGIEESAILCAEVLTCLKNGDSMESIMRTLSVSEEFVQKVQALLAK
jgi:predicted transposase YdaD